jgi:RNA-directed DNA polymerase
VVPAEQALVNQHITMFNEHKIENKIVNKSEKKIKAHSLIGRIDSTLMYKAWKNVRRNRGAAGIDKESIQMFERNLNQNLQALMRQLKIGTYQPIPLRRRYIEKGIGKIGMRPLGIPSVRCRIAQETVRLLINPIYEKIFHQNSFGFRSGRSCHQAVSKVLELTKQGYTHVVDADIKGFFDNIPHHLIMKAMTAEIADGKVLTLIERFLKAGVMEEGTLYPTTRGTPQGGLISPLIANAVLNYLDHKLSEHGYRFVRYADDFVVLCRTKTQAESALAFIKSVIEKDLELELSPEKTKISSSSEGFKFLGFLIKRGRVEMGEKAMERFKAKVRMITTRSHNYSKDKVEELNMVIRGTLNYFVTPVSNSKQFRKLDEWIRKRLRCMKFKRISRKDNLRLKVIALRKTGFLMCLDLFAMIKTKLINSHTWATVLGTARC